MRPRSRRLLPGQAVIVPGPPRRRTARTAKAAGRAVAWSTRRSYTHRRGLTPMFVLAALAAAVTAARCWPVEFGSRGVTGLLVFAAIAIAGRHAWTYRRHHPWPWPTVIHVWGSYAAAAAWAITVATVGWSPGAVFWLAGPWLGSSIRYWWLLRERDDQLPAEGPLDQILNRWYTKIAGPNQVLTDAILVDVKFIDRNPAIGWEADVEVDPTRHTTQDVIHAAPRIAGVWAVPVTSVLVTPTASAAANMAHVRVFKRNPLQAVQPFDQPTIDCDTGRFVIGVHPDNSPAYWRLWTPGSGAVHGLYAGTTGSGKSALATLLANETLASQVAIACIGDTENGESVPALQEDVHVFTGTVSNIRDMLLGLVAVGRHRRDTRSRTRSASGQRGKGFFEPSREEPLWVCILEEPSLAMEDPIIARCVKEIGTKFRKYGISVNLGPQVPSLAELGNDLTIRSMLAGGNVVIFRTGDRMSGTMATPVDLVIDPSKLPESWPDGSTTAGLGMVANEAGRTKPMRARFIADPYHLVKQLPKIPAPTDEVAVFNRASGGLWDNWRARLDDEPEINEHDPLAALIAGERPASPANAGSVVAGPPASKREQILAYVRGKASPVTTGVIRQAVDAPLSTVSTTCKRLAEEGLLIAVTRGVWQDPDAYQAAKEATERLLNEAVA